MPTISVIVPVYNVEKYLRCCVDSILAQTFTDIEVLLVDDGSTDSSGAICDEYAQLDRRVRVFHKTNGGVSSARNLGLDEATGKWIMFVDSDDKVAPIICERLLATTVEDVLPICSYFEWKDNVINRGSPDINKNHYLIQEFVELRVWLMPVWGKLFERRIINRENLRFDLHISYGEDTVFNYDYLQYITEIVILDIPMYYYRIIPYSLSHGKYIPNYEKVMDYVFNKRLLLAEKLSVDSSEFLEKHFSAFFMEIFNAFENNMCADAPGTLKQKIQRNSDILRSNEFKKAYPYCKKCQCYFNGRYFFMLKLSYYTGTYFWLWFLGMLGKIKDVFRGKCN